MIEIGIRPSEVRPIGHLQQRFRWQHCRLPGGKHFRIPGMKIIYPIHYGIQAVVILVPCHAQYTPDAGGIFIAVLLCLSFLVCIEAPYTSMPLKIGSRIKPFATRHSSRASLLNILSGICRSTKGYIHMPMVVKCHGLGRMPMAFDILIFVGEDNPGFTIGNKLSRFQFIPEHLSECGSVQITIMDYHAYRLPSLIFIVTEIGNNIGLTVIVSIPETYSSSPPSHDIVINQFYINIAIVIYGYMPGPAKAICHYHRFEITGQYQTSIIRIAGR
jgi:hypothetical protein